MPPRLLHVVDNGSLAGGAQRLVLGLLLNNRSTGWEPLLASPCGDLLDEARAGGIPIVEVHFDRRFSLQVVRTLVAAVRHHKVAVLHSHLPMSNIHAHAASLVTRAKHVGTLHAEGDVYTAMFRRFLRLARRTGFSPVSVSLEAAKSVHRLIGGAPITHIYNSIDTNYFSTPNRTTVNPASPLIGCIGRLHPHKGQDVLLQAFAIVHREFPAARLALVGNGEDESKLRRLVSKLHIEESVVFHGYQRDVRPHLASFTLSAVPSRHESFGIVVLEAGMMGKPVVATRVGGIPEVIDDAVNGLLVPAGNPEAFATALLSLLRNPQHAAQLGDSLRRRVQQHFSIQQCAKLYARFYTDMLKL